MFSGIVEEKAKVVRAEEVVPGQLTRIWVARPESFDDLGLGDSIATDGVCLTIEAIDQKTIQFALAAETLAVTNWSSVEKLVGRTVNLERSLKFGDRIHGHLVSGHVDAAARVTKIEDVMSERVLTRMLFVDVPKELGPMVWKKGSWALNGVSLTVNSVEGGVAGHCLIPETLLRTNLGDLKVNDLVNIEVDTFARALAQTVDDYLARRFEQHQNNDPQGTSN